jgi:hypothetical protein
VYQYYFKADERMITTKISIHRTVLFHKLSNLYCSKMCTLSTIIHVNERERAHNQNIRTIQDTDEYRNSEIHA